jgi:RNA polymerase sigma-70 factor (ECF subfamily)
MLILDPSKYGKKAVVCQCRRFFLGRPGIGIFSYIGINITKRIDENTIGKEPNFSITVIFIGIKWVSPTFTIIEIKSNRSKAEYRMKNQFNDIALSHFNALYGFALSITGVAQDAEDLVQETYLRAYRKFDQFAFGTSCKAWLFRIMRNIAIDQIRKKDPLLASGNESCLDEIVCPKVNADHLPCTIDIKRAFGGLPPKYQIIVLLKDIEGFTYQEIAEILNFPIGTVMSRLYRGRKALKSILSVKKPPKSVGNILELKK